MACSKPLNLRNLLEITRSDSELVEFLRFNNLLFSFEGSCEYCVNGLLVLRVDNTTRDGYGWRCTNRRCTHKVSFRKHSFFSGSQLSLATVVEIIYYWTYRYPQEIVLHETGLSSRTVSNFYHLFREVFSVILEEQSKPVGGPGVVIEIDEWKFEKRKLNKGRPVDGLCMFGGIERDSDPPKCFVVPVEDHTASSLIPLIKQWILPGTTVLSDGWKAYKTLQAEELFHQTGNHSLNFVTLSGTHTNNIKSHWHSLKRYLPRTQKASYFVEYCIRRKTIDVAPDKFISVLHLLGSVYNPHRSREFDNQLTPDQELLSVQQNTTPASAALATADNELVPQAIVKIEYDVFQLADIPNLGFKLFTMIYVNIFYSKYC